MKAVLSKGETVTVSGDELGWEDFGAEPEQSPRMMEHMATLYGRRLIPQSEDQLRRATLEEIAQFFSNPDLRALINHVSARAWEVSANDIAETAKANNSE